MGFTVAAVRSVLVEATDFITWCIAVSTTLQNNKQGSYTIDATTKCNVFAYQNFPLTELKRLLLL
jgi:hypothetical protein